MSAQKLRELVLSQQIAHNQTHVQREIFSKILHHAKIPHVVIIKGLRRVGKSVLLSQLQHKLTQYARNYVNFDDERLIDFTVEQFDELYTVLLGFDTTQKIFFFDEIQELPGWERAIRRLYDLGIKFYVTGSNASLLSRELGTKLTGRHVEVEVLPFSYKEYIAFHHIQYTADDMLIPKKKAVLQKKFDSYMQEGGMPEYITYKSREILKQVYEDILLKDIIVRYKLTDEKGLKQLAYYMLTNVGKLYSYNSLAKSLDFGSLNTVKKYISYCQDAYLLFEVEKFDYSLKKQIKNQKKAYVIDVGFINLLSFSFSKNTGRMLENMVYIHLRRSNEYIYYHKQKHECDFVIKQGTRIVQAYQVCYELTQDNTKREYAGLVEACKAYNLSQAMLLTYEQEQTVVVEGITIHILPVWKWMLTSTP